MPIAAGISAAGAIGSAAIGAGSSYLASKEQSKQAQNALDFQKSVYAANQGNLSPWIKTGQSANYSLASLYGLPTPDNPEGGAAGVNSAWDAFSKLPAFTFPLQQGSLALERQLNAQGRTQSGAQARASQQFGQGLASQYMMSNYVNPLMQISGQGQNAASSLAGVNNQSANMIGNSYGNLGAAQASGWMGMGNSLAGGFQNGANSLAIYSALGKGGNLSPTYAGSGGTGGFAPTDGWGNALNNGWSGGQW